MSLYRDLKNKRDLTEREADIRDYIVRHPEQIVSMSCRELGEATYTSAATVTRFCKKLGFRGYPAFKLQFSSEIAAGHATEVPEEVQLSAQDTLLSVLEKVSGMEERALEATREALSLPQLLRIHTLLRTHPYLDFYAYDMNVQLARYAASLYVHAGKTVAVYGESNEQVLSALNAEPASHLAILISHTGESRRLIELSDVLRKRACKRIVITSGKDTTLARHGGEFLFAPAARGVENLWESMFSTGVKFLIDVLYAMMFSLEYDERMKINRMYEKLGAETFWNLTRTDLFGRPE